MQGLSTEAQGHKGYLNKCQQVGVFDASIVQDYAVWSAVAHMSPL